MKHSKITAKFEIVTPMFLGDSAQDATSIRAASIKGALGFWWRALNYSRFVADSTTQNEALAKMQSEERELFGSTDGQGKFLLRVVESDLEFLDKGKVMSSRGGVKTNADSVVGIGARYLGCRVIQTFNSRATQDRGELQKGELLRECIVPGSKFCLEIVSKKNHSEVVEDELLPVLKLFGMIGSLGARVRRGWGSLKLEELDVSGVEQDLWSSESEGLDAFNEGLFNLLKQTREAQVSSQKDQGVFRLTAFSQRTDIRIGTNLQNSAVEALDDLGKGFARYRSRGKDKGNLDGLAVDASFVDDHDWYRQVNLFSDNKEGRGDYVPARTAFGLPHNYNARTFGITGVNDIDRRGSPLMFHIHKIGQQFIGVALYFPEQFLPSNSLAVWKRTRGAESKIAKSYTFNPEIITNFLDGRRYVDNAPSVQAERPYFPSVKVFE